MVKVIKPKKYNVTINQTITIQKKFTAWKPEQALEMAKEDYWDMPPMKAKHIILHMPMTAEVEEV
tara:strand:- start:19040 stop:19234 length:195 start_codon:yes stop_codon:yes gene_type:complete